MVIIESYLGSASCITTGGREMFRIGGHTDLPNRCKIRINRSVENGRKKAGAKVSSVYPMLGNSQRAENEFEGRGCSKHVWTVR